MTPTTSPTPSRSTRRRPEHASAYPQARGCAAVGHRAPRTGNSVLSRYVDPGGRYREVLARPGTAGSVLVLDRDAETRSDRRLVAHLAADEPPENARLVCHHYLQDARGRRCRPVTAEDFKAPCPALDAASDRVCDAALDAALNAAPDRPPVAPRSSAQTTGELVDRHGHPHRLGRVSSGLSITELRWVRYPRPGEDGESQPVSMREVVACLESYEPVRARTVAALARHGADPAVSVAVLRAELMRLDASRIVLNRGLRHAVLSAVRAQGLSMSEVAIRCGRVKYDSRGKASGETSWLARRIGLSPEGGESAPTPWVHSEVLALIARAGLGISPREVELG